MEMYVSSNLHQFLCTTKQILNKNNKLKANIFEISTTSYVVRKDTSYQYCLHMDDT